MEARPVTRAGVALVIGVGQYQRSKEIDPLPFADKDAKAVARLLASPRVCALPHDQVKLLTNQNARRATIADRLSRWLPERSRGAEIAVVYFACHGMVQSIGNSEEGYLLPFDFDPRKIGASGIAMSDINKWINAVQASFVVLILDCCHAGKVLKGELTTFRSQGRDLELRPALLQALSRNGLFVITSCDGGEKSIESPKLGHGLFTYHLLEGMKGRGDQNRDGKVGVAELFNYVSKAVAKDAKEMFQHKQTPWTKTSYNEEVMLSWAQKRQSQEASHPELQRLASLWKERGSDHAMGELERRLPEMDDTAIQAVLAFLRSRQVTAAIPFLFHCLSRRHEAIRSEAISLAEEFDWNQLSEAAREIAGHLEVNGSAERIGFILEGLAALESKDEVITLLDELEIILTGALKARADRLLKRKRLSQGMEQVAGLFLQNKSHYRIIEVLGQGVFTSAYKGVHDLTKLPVVVRVLRNKYVDDPEVRDIFLEVGMRSFVHYVHPNLVHTRDVQGIVDRRLYYTVRDYVPGVTLQDALDKGKRFEPLQVLEILRQTLAALAPLHDRGEFHGGIKPSNIFFSDGVPVRVILGDPCLPSIQRGLQRPGYDYRYLAPEMIRGGALDPRLDFYALGCVGYELACGSPPFDVENPYDLGVIVAIGSFDLPSRRDSRLGPQGDAFFKRLLAREPSDRFPNILEISTETDQLADALRSPSQSRSRPVTLLGQKTMYQLGSLNSLVSLKPKGENDSSAVDERESGDTIHKRPEAARRSDHTVLPPVAVVPRADTVTPSPRLPEASPAPDWSSLPEVIGPGVTLLGGKYVVIRKLGEGGMGSVWLVEHQELAQHRALKLINASYAADQEVRQRFRLEAKILARLRHPNAVVIHDTGFIQQILYIDMEYLEGATLRKRMTPGQPLPTDFILWLLGEMQKVIDHAHSLGIVHRDLKPENIMIVEDPTTRRQEVKVLDFGIAKLVGKGADEYASQTNNTQGPLGTLAYASPEQINFDLEAGTPKIDHRSDVYSLGVMLFEMLTGHRPFKGSASHLLFQNAVKRPPPFSMVAPDLEFPPGVEDVVRRALEKDPQDRPQSVHELYVELSRAAAATSESLPDQSPREETFEAVEVPPEELGRQPEPTDHLVVPVQAHDFWKLLRTHIMKLFGQS
jgi:serine/threonine protein kinase/uncharacterized caspase-like protein